MLPLSCLDLALALDCPALLPVMLRAVGVSPLPLFAGVIKVTGGMQQYALPHSTLPAGGCDDEDENIGYYSS